MADTGVFDLPSLLAQLGQFNAYLQPPPDELARQRRAALQTGLLSLLGTPRGQEGAAIGRAGLLGMAARDDALHQWQQQRRGAIADAAALMDLQAKGQALAQQRQIAALAPRFTTPGSEAMGPPTAAGAVQPATPPGFDYQGYAGALSAIDPLKGLALAQALKKEQPKVKDVHYDQDASGRPMTWVMFEDGTTKQLPGIVPREKITWENAGGQLVPRGEYGAVPNVAPIPVGISPNTAATVGATLRGQDLSNAIQRGELGVAQANAATARERLALERQNAAAGKWVNDLERGVQVSMDTGATRPIVGAGNVPIGEKGAEQIANRQRDTVQMADRVLSMVADVKPRLGFGVTGASGYLQAFRPGSEAYDVRAKIQSIKANLGFEQLQALRASSPTGGALGQTSNNEIDMLQSSVANLDPNQSKEAVTQGLEAVEKHLTNVKRIIAQEQARKSTPVPAATTAPNIKALLDKYAPQK